MRIPSRVASDEPQLLHKHQWTFSAGWLGLMLMLATCLTACPTHNYGAAPVRYLPKQFPSWTYEAALPVPAATSEPVSYCSIVQQVTRSVRRRYPLVSVYGVHDEARGLEGVALALPFECIGDDGTRAAGPCTASGPAFLEQSTGTWDTILVALARRFDARRARFRFGMVYVGQPNLVVRGPASDWSAVVRVSQGGSGEFCWSDPSENVDPRRGVEVRAYVYEYYRDCEACPVDLMTEMTSTIPRDIHLRQLGLL